MFFLCRLMECKSFSMLIILIDRWQVLSYLIRVPLLNQANHAIWQKAWFTSIVLTVFSGVWKWMPPKKKKELVRFSSSTPRQKKTTESFCRQRVGFEINRERQGLLLQSRKMAKRWQSSWKPIETTAESSFTSSLRSIKWAEVDAINFSHFVSHRWHIDYSSGLGRCYLVLSEDLVPRSSHSLSWPPFWINFHSPWTNQSRDFCCVPGSSLLPPPYWKARRHWGRGWVRN